VGASGTKQIRRSLGSRTKTTFDDATSEDQESSELLKIKRRLKKLEINSVDDQMSNRLESPKSHKTLKKRLFRQLERQDLLPDFAAGEDDIYSSSLESQS
jgi:hypothetical protein